MQGYVSVKEKAAQWGLTRQRVAEFCKAGRVPGAIKQGKAWKIPENAKKPMDKRSGVPTEDRNRLPLPIGISDYRLASTAYYYIDKTLMIKTLLDEKAQVSLFTRPRRFGKTLNMDMLRTFFEKTDEDTSIYFRDKKIWQCGEAYQKEQGRYPVIFVTFKDIKCDSWEDTYGKLADVVGNEFVRHIDLLESPHCSETDKRYFRKVVDRSAAPSELESAFLYLSKMLHEHHKAAPFIMIDEYDTPIQQGHSKGFYDKIIGFMRNFFSAGLKDNKHLSYGFLTGILRVAKESIFSGLNNLKINSILDSKYSECFGFTRDEVIQMAEYYHAADKMDEICTWYDGYRFGKTDIFNPWSVINYFGNDCEPRAFWQATGSNEIIGDILEHADEEIVDNLNHLLQGDTVSTYIDTDIIYPQIKAKPSAIYSFLLVAGYLKVTDLDYNFSGGYLGKVALPNKEIAFVYNKEVLAHLEPVIQQSTVISVQEAIYEKDAEKLQKTLRKLLLESVSSFDAVHENFYHGLLLGLCAMVDNRYLVRSNRESGEGRYDIRLTPRYEKYPGILIELKYQKGSTPKELKDLASNAIKQIREKNYAAELSALGVKTVFRYGVAFSGKDVEIVVD